MSAKPKFEPTQGVDVGFDETFLKKWMIFERIAWIVIASVLVAGLSGVLGRGPLAKSKVSSGGDMEVRYERIARNKTPAEMSVHLNRAPLINNAVRLRLEGDLFHRGRITRILPQPKTWTPTSEGATVEFAPTSDGTVSIIQEPGSPGASGIAFP